jgi:isopropylmalate/homocitrate/citramalate synthase
MDRSGLSLYNHLHRPSAPRAPIVINDCTLREGAQGAGVQLSRNAAVEIARELDRAGVPQLQVPISGDLDANLDLIAAIRDAGVRARLEGLVGLYTPGWRDEVDRAAKAGVNVISIMHATSPLRLQTIGRSQDEAIAISTDAIAHARRAGCVATLTPADTTRTEPAFFGRVVTAAHAAGARRIVVTDTAGAATPRGIATLVDLAVMLAPIEIQVHCHNDLGLAVAGGLAGVEAGATVIDTTVLGLGERAGNPPLDEVAVALEAAYGVDTGIDLSRLSALATLVARHFGIDVPLMKPLVGPRAFRWDHADIPLPIPASTVGSG